MLRAATSIAAIALLGAGQALLPANTAAAINLNDGPECAMAQEMFAFGSGHICVATSGGGGVKDDKDRFIFVVDTKPYDPGAYKGPGGRPLGTPPRPSVGKDGDAKGGGEAGGGGRRHASMGPPAKSQGEKLELLKKCLKVYAEIERLEGKLAEAKRGMDVGEYVYVRDLDVARGRLGRWERNPLSVSEINHRLNDKRDELQREYCASVLPPTVF